MTTVPERLASLETMQRAHEGRHQRFEERLSEDMAAFGLQMQGMSRHLASVESTMEEHARSNGSGSRLRQAAPLGLGSGGAAIGVAVIKLLEYF